jgi:hypothetical protein
VCLVSAVSRGRYPGNCFPQLGPQLCVITGQAVTSRSRSSPILMGWWSEQRKDYRSPLVKLANITTSVKGSTKRGIIVQAPAASPSTWGAFTHFLDDEARCHSKSARWRCRVSFAKEKMCHGIPEEPARRDRTLVPLFCLDGPTEKYGCIIPRTKSARPELTKKLAAFRTLASCQGPYGAI